MSMASDGTVIELREHHIVELARIVAAQQGEPAGKAPTVRPSCNFQKSSRLFRGACGHAAYDEGDAQWVAIEGDDEDGWNPVCRECLPGRIERGEVVLDRLSAHETLAYMLGGPEGRDAYLEYFHPALTLAPPVALSDAEAHTPGRP